MSRALRVHCADADGQLTKRGRLLRLDASKLAVSVMAAHPSDIEARVRTPRRAYRSVAVAIHTAHVPFAMRCLSTHAFMTQSVSPHTMVFLTMACVVCVCRHDACPGRRGGVLAAESPLQPSKREGCESRQLQRAAGMGGDGRDYVRTAAGAPAAGARAGRAATEDRGA